MALDPRLSHAFDVHLAKVPRAVLTRTATLLAVFVFAYFVRHWGAWTFFGIVALLQTPAIVALLFIRRANLRARARLDGEPSRLAWLHTAKEARGDLHRVELHEPSGSQTILFVDAKSAADAVEAARAMSHGPRVTTSDAERSAPAPAV